MKPSNCMCLEDATFLRQVTCGLAALDALPGRFRQHGDYDSELCFVARLPLLPPSRRPAASSITNMKVGSFFDSATARWMLLTADGLLGPQHSLDTRDGEKFCLGDGGASEPDRTGGI